MKTFKMAILRTTSLSVCIITTIVLGLTSCANNQKQEDSPDAQFLVTAAKINLEEMELGQLAQKNGMSDDVKNLGKNLETDHANALNDLKDLAAKKNIKIPTDLTGDSQNNYKKLVDKTGNEFDKAYCDMMVAGHKAAIEKFTKESKDTTDPDIREWAASMIPVLSNHLSHSIECRKECEKM
jgi:putative membrane protein